MISFFVKTISFLFILFLFFLHVPTSAQESSLPSITVINPIRGNELGLENADLLESLKGQWSQTKPLGIKATWLWQYSALENKELVDFGKKEMIDQEFGLFLEIDRNLAAKSDVAYRGRGPWYFSDGIYLLSYDPVERKKIIDEVFKKFYGTFGYYPKTVGGWWISADTLDYIHEKYGVIASLRAADQLDLDVYSIWGTPWSVPYLSSQTHAGIPAGSLEESTGTVILQWAPRDPTWGYDASPSASLFSIQDYFLKNLDSDYYRYLLSTYLKNPNAHAVIGYEGGFEPEFYTEIYSTHLRIARELEDERKVKIVTASEYAQQFLDKSVFEKSTSLLTQDYENQDQSFWYHSPYYRVGILKKGTTVSLVDVRDYTSQTQEEFYHFPNSQGYLRISTDALIDSARNKGDERVIGSFEKPLEIKEQGTTVQLISGGIVLAALTPENIFIKSSMDGKDTLFDFKKENTSSQLFYIIFLAAFILYGIFLFYYFKNLFQALIHSGILFIPLLLSYPIFGTLSENISTYIDAKQLFLSPFLSLRIFTFSERMTIFFSALPLLFVFGTHLIFILRKEMKKGFILFAIVYLLVVLLFLRLPYFPLDRTSFLELAGILGSVVFIGLVCNIYLWMRFKSVKNILYGMLVMGGFLLFIGVTIITSRSTVVLTPFEKQVLRAVQSEKKDILFIAPQVQPIYKSLRPLFLKNLDTASSLTGHKWTSISRENDQMLNLSEEKRLILIPRYLGSTLYTEEIEMMKGEKIFDNAQVAIYKVK